MDARHQFAHLEGLGDVVVRADLQPDHAVGQFGARGQHDDWQVTALADFPAQRQAVFAGQREIEHHQVVVAHGHGGAHGGAALRAVGLDAEGGEVFGQHGADLRVVVDDQQVQGRSGR